MKKDFINMSRDEYLQMTDKQKETKYTVYFNNPPEYNDVMCCPSAHTQPEAEKLAEEMHGKGYADVWIVKSETVKSYRNDLPDFGNYDQDGSAERKYFGPKDAPPN